MTEGFTRLDALNRIGNAVFNADLDRSANRAPIDAPVNYPHIWSTSWFDWVQYDGSIMQPLTRNTGEALGVKAFVDASGPDVHRFASSVNVNNLIKIENWLAGTHPQENNNQFNGLLAPKWPDSFPAIDANLAEQGKQLYHDMCRGCHLPTTDTEEFWSDRYWKKIKYLHYQDPQQTEQTYLKVKIIPVDVMGTDPAQAGVLVNRTVDTTDLNLNTEVCTWAAGSFSTDETVALRFVPLKDSATANFGLALGAFVERTNDQWFKQNYVPQAQHEDYEGNRPNCLQVGKGYKARPLNGVWATAPFLHNGSIASLYDLLSPQEQRPTFVQLGHQEFDAKHVGIKQDEVVQALNKTQEHSSYKTTADYVDGLFILDTRQPGNYNTGHVFDDKPKDKNGVIGRKLSEEEKLALIEFLKTL